MEIDGQWNDIRKIFGQALKSTGHVAVATTGPDGSPHITPIGSLVLLDGCRGYYCDEFPRIMAANLKVNQRVSILAVNSSRWYWIRSLYSGKFATSPGLRLMGKAGPRRRATEAELDKWLSRVRMFRKFKGYDLLWANMRHIREIAFDSFEPLRIGTMGRYDVYPG